MKSLVYPMVAMFLCVFHTQAWAQQWAPNKPVRLIVPQVAGGGADAI